MRTSARTRPHSKLAFIHAAGAVQLGFGQMNSALVSHGCGHARTGASFYLQPHDIAGSHDEILERLRSERAVNARRRRRVRAQRRVYMDAALQIPIAIAYGADVQ